MVRDLCSNGLEKVLEAEDLLFAQALLMRW